MENPSNMDEQAQLIEALIQRAEQYGKTRLEIVRLKALNKSAVVISSLVAQLAVAMLILLFVLILEVAVGLCIGEVFGHYSYGFFIVAGFDVLVGLVLYVFRKQIFETPISESILKQIMD